MRTFAILLLLLTSTLALAEGAFSVEKALQDGVVTDEELQDARRQVPWTGRRDDPFLPMVDRSAVLDPSVCTSTEPPGWANASYIYRATNKTRSAIRLDIDGAPVDVLVTRRPGVGPERIHAVFSFGLRGWERHTALPPGRTCYGIFPYAHASAWERDRHFRWTLNGTELFHRGAPGVPVSVPIMVPGEDEKPKKSGMEFEIYTAPLFEGPSTPKEMLPAISDGNAHYRFEHSDF